MGTKSAILDFPFRKYLSDFSSRISAPSLSHFNLTDFPAKKSSLIAHYDYKAHWVLFHELTKICHLCPRPPFVHFSSISFLLSAVEQITIRRRPLHQQVHGHISKLLATQVASFTPKTRRRVRKMRPGSDRTKEEELTLLVGFLQWRDSRSRPTQSGKTTRKSLNISLFLQLKKVWYIVVLLFCRWLYNTTWMSRVPCSANHHIWYRLQAFNLEMYSDFYGVIERTVYIENKICISA